MERQTVVTWMINVQPVCRHPRLQQTAPPSISAQLKSRYGRKLPLIYTTKEMERVGLDKRKKTIKKNKMKV